MKALDVIGIATAAYALGVWTVIPFWIKSVRLVDELGRRLRRTIR